MEDRASAQAPPKYVIFLLASFFGITGLGSAAVAVATPDLVLGLGSSLETGALVVSVYALALAVGSPVFGRLGDAYGLRIPLLVGTALMVLGVVVGAAAPTIEVLLTGRLLQGIGASALPSLSLAALQMLYTGKSRALALSAYSGLGGMFNALGPIIGGVLVVYVGWRPVVLLPAVIIVALPFVWSFLPAGRGSGVIDLIGGVIVTIAATGVLLVVQMPRTGVTFGILGAVLFAAAAPLLVRHISRNPFGFTPKVLVTNRVIMLTVLGSMGIPAAWFSLLVAIPAGMAVQGYDGLAIGVALLPGAGMGLLAPRIVGRLLSQRGPLWCLTVSNFVVAVALLLAAWGLASERVLPLAVGFALLIAMLSLGQPASISIVSHVAPDEVRGVAMGLMTFSFMLGGSLGGAYVGGMSALLGLDAALLILVAVPLLGVWAVRSIPEHLVRIPEG